jgi:lantibiotic leader peptide-processing serine protease
MHMRGDALRRLAAGVSFLFVAACSEQPTTTPKARFSPAVASRIGTASPDRQIFALNGKIPADFERRVAALGGSVVRVVPQINMVVTSGLSESDAASLASKNEVGPDVVARWVPTPEELNVSIQSLDVGTMATAKSPLTAAFLPIQWNMRQIHATEAWAAFTGVPSVRVAILDTGLDPDHIDQNGTVIDAASSVAFTPSLSGPPEWADDQFHGTHVGGIVTTNNIGTAGVAPNVTLIAVKVLNAAGVGAFGDIIAGIVYATDVHAQVINMSLGATIPKEFHVGPAEAVYNRAINYAKRHGVLVVSAAGNENTDLQHGHEFISLPCEAGVQMCISATGPTDTKASYSNYGTNVINVAAPGGDSNAPPLSFVLSLCSSRSVLPILAPCKDRMEYLFVDGTSQAAPHVAGLGALVYSQYARFGTMPEPSQVITLIEQNADDLGKPGVDPYYGKGRINVLHTLMAAPQH